MIQRLAHSAPVCDSAVFRGSLGEIEIPEQEKLLFI
jgi:hypothetical protein